MYKKIVVSISVFLISFCCFIGCTDLINVDSRTDVKFNLDISKIIKSARSEDEQNANILENDSQDYVLKVSLYNTKNFDENTKNLQTDLLISETQAKIVNGIANVNFENIVIGLDVIILVDLYEYIKTDSDTPENLNLIYAGSSPVFKVKRDNNQVNIVLKKVQIDDIIPNPDDNPDIGENPGVNENPDDKPDDTENPTPDIPVVEPIAPTILIQPENVLKVFANESEATEIKNAQLSCSAFVSDGGTLSFDWYLVDSENNISLIENDTETTNDLVKTSTIIVDAKIGESKTFYCVISNTLDDKVVTVNSNLATVACVIGVLDSFTAKYTGDYELYGIDYNEIRKNIEITEYYKDEFDNVATLTYNNPSEDKFTIDINSGYESYIGFVPFSITENTLKTQQEIIVPVKYQLESDKFEYKFAYTVDENIIFDLTDNVLVPQYFTNLSYKYINSSIPTKIRDESGTLSDFVITDNLDMSVSSENGNSFDTVATSVYTVSISPKNNWFLGTVYKDFNVQVCPWQIKFKDSTGSDVSASQITSGQTYTINISNDALSPNYVLPSVTFSGQGVNGTVFTLPESGSSTIYANSNGNQLAIIEVTPALVGINVSLPTYTDIEGLQSPAIIDSTVTFSVANNYSSYEWYIDFEKQSETNKTFTFYTDNMTGGIYSIMLIVTDTTGNTYSAEYQLEIQK